MAAIGHVLDLPGRTGLTRHADALLQAEVRRLALTWPTVEPGCATQAGDVPAAAGESGASRRS
jgi:hypothetical protein